MSKNLTRHLVSMLFIALVSSPLFSTTLETILQQASVSSPQMQSFALNKKNTELAVSISDTDDELGIEVTSGNVTAMYDDAKNAYIFNTSGIEATFTLPDDGDTTITVGTGAVAYTPNGDIYSLAPGISSTHTFTYGETGDNRSSLLSKQNLVLAGFTYENNVISFENSVYQQIIALLTNEKSQKATEKQLSDLEKEVSDALSLKTLSKESLSYQSQLNSLQSLKSSLSSLENNHTLLKQQYTLLTGLAWEGVSSIPVPDLAYASNPNGNTNVSLKSLAIQVASEDLKIAKAALTNKNLIVGGGLSASSSNDSLGWGTSYGISSFTGLKGNVQASLSSKNFSVGAKFNGTYDMDDQEFSPSLTVSGTWKNNASALSETLNLQKLENNVLIAQIEYTNALNDYLVSEASLNGQIARWQLDYALLQNSMEYNMQALEYQKTLLSRGLAKQSDVDSASHVVEQDAYEMAITLLEGLVVQNSIRSMQI